MEHTPLPPEPPIEALLNLKRGIKEKTMLLRSTSVNNLHRYEDNMGSVAQTY